MYKRIIAALAIAGMAAFAMAAVAALAGARINTSPSIPLGLYWAVDAPLKLGEYVQVCPPPSGVFDAARTRGYIGAGRCAGGYGYLMKRVAALGGDDVFISENGVRINDRWWPDGKPMVVDTQARPMPRIYPSRHILTARQVLLMGDGRKSFDARYFGLMDVAQIVSVIRPVFTW